PKSESPLAGTQRLEDPLDEIDLLIKSTQDEALKDRLTGVKTVIEANVATRNEQRGRSALSTLQVTTFLITRLKHSQRLVEASKRAQVRLASARATGTSG